MTKAIWLADSRGSSVPLRPRQHSKSSAVCNGGGRLFQTTEAEAGATQASQDGPENECPEMWVGWDSRVWLRTKARKPQGLSSGLGSSGQRTALLSSRRARLMSGVSSPTSLSEASEPSFLMVYCLQILGLVYCENNDVLCLGHTSHYYPCLFMRQNWRSLAATERQPDNTLNPSITVVHTLYSTAVWANSTTTANLLLHPRWPPLDYSWPERVDACYCALLILNVFLSGEEHWNLIWLLCRCRLPWDCLENTHYFLRRVQGQMC